MGRQGIQFNDEVVWSVKYRGFLYTKDISRNDPSLLPRYTGSHHIRKTEIEVERIKNQLIRLMMKNEVSAGRYKSPSTPLCHDQSQM